MLIGIAAQQSLSNVFAGMVLLLSRPFRVGDPIQLRAGALGGQLQGVVTEIGITYIRLDTGDTVMSVPNSQVLAAAVGPIPRHADKPAPPPVPGAENPATRPPAPAPTPDARRGRDAVPVVPEQAAPDGPVPGVPVLPEFQMILMSAGCSCWSGRVRVPVSAYDLTAGCPLG